MATIIDHRYSKYLVVRCVSMFYLAAAGHESTRWPRAFNSW